MREALRAGAIPGPRLLVAGTPITITAGHCWFFGTEADTTDEVVTAVRRQVRLGADLIKVMATGGMFTPTANPYRAQYGAETLAAAVEEAERVDLPIVAHTLAAEGAQNCVEAGIHHHIHARWFGRDGQLDYLPDVVQRMADEGRWVDPTIGHMLLGMQARGNDGGGAPESARPHLDLLQRMDEAGVSFTSGLDMGLSMAPHDLTAANAWAFVEWLGWTPWRALYTCTAGTAEGILLGDLVGRIKPGLVADLAAFEGDPAQDIRRLHTATSVVQAGRPVKLDHRGLV